MGRDQRRGRRKDCRVVKEGWKKGTWVQGHGGGKRSWRRKGATPTSRAAPNRTDLGSVVCKCIDSTDRSKRRYQVARLGPLVWNSVASNFHDRDELQSCGCVIAFDLPPPSDLDGPKRAHPDHTFHCCTPCRPLGGGCHSAGGHQALAPPPPLSKCAPLADGRSRRAGPVATTHLRHPDGGVPLGGGGLCGCGWEMGSPEAMCGSAVTI